MKTIVGLAILVVIVATAFVTLGAAEKNHMLALGLLLAMFSSLVTIALAAMAKIQAVRTVFEPTPEVIERKSSTFTNITAIQSFPTEDHRELASLRQDLTALTQKLGNAEFQILSLKTHMRLCFDNIRYHREITLPHALAGQAGALIVSTILALIGTVLSAFPDDAYRLAQAGNGVLVTGWQNVALWFEGLSLPVKS